MNPASIFFTKSNLNSGIITIASKFAHGKSLFCNSILQQLIVEDYNVLMFKEGSLKIKLNNDLKIKKSKSIIINDFGFSPKDIYLFNRIINHHLLKLSGKIAIIIDSPDFLINCDFELYYEKLKENTRYVFCEKNQKKIQYYIERIKNKSNYETAQQNVQSLLELSNKFNMPIIITTQFKKSIEQFEGGTREVEEINRSLAFNSKLIIGVKKVFDLKPNSANTFEIKVLKSRFDSINKIINCIFDTNSYSLVTNYK